MVKKIKKVGGAYFGAYSSSGKSSSNKSFSPVLDSSNRAIRGLWKRRNVFYARLSLSDHFGRKNQRRIPLKATTAIQAQAELEYLRKSRTFPAQPKSSLNWSDYWPSYLASIKQLKRPRKVNSERLPWSLDKHAKELQPWRDCGCPWELWNKHWARNDTRQWWECRFHVSLDGIGKFYLEFYIITILDGIVT